ncbi:tandem-type lipoprotein [Staphylococcus caprae]|nr:tandem-type lipoprotein [Staphylococcus caprae]QJE25965.1 tandem-type lipoprotein [Staphylococcus caprae]
MNLSKKWILVIAIPLAIVVIIVGGWYCLKLNKEKEVKDSFAKTLDMYPIKNLEDLYDKEGYRDENFDKNDKGTWVLSSEMSIRKNSDKLVSKGMVLFMNRNNKKSKGFYYINTFYDRGPEDDHEKRIPVKLENKKIIVTKNLKDKRLKNEIERFKFFSQYAKFNNLSQYKNGDITYNPEVPSYSAEYELTNTDENVKELRKRYDIPTNNSPKLLLKGKGNIKGSSVGDKTIEYTFEENKKSDIYYTDSLTYQPSDH